MNKKKTEKHIFMIGKYTSRTVLSKPFYFLLTFRAADCVIQLRTCNCHLCVLNFFPVFASFKNGGNLFPGITFTTKEDGFRSIMEVNFFYFTLKVGIGQRFAMEWIHCVECIY